MADRRELWLPKTSAGNLKEQLARTTLQKLRSQGHTYVELREDGKRLIFFCTLCLAPCYSDSVLLDHLHGNLHKERLTCAKATLFGPNPWPFEDGVLFFDNSDGNEEKQVVLDDKKKCGLLDHEKESNNHAIVKYCANTEIVRNVEDEYNRTKFDDESSPVRDWSSVDLPIKGVLIKEKTVDLRARFIGIGKIAARSFEKEADLSTVSRIWCEWLGHEEVLDEEISKIPVHDFAVVTFTYYYNLGRLGVLEDVKYLLTSGEAAESENAEDNVRKRKKSFSDPEDTSECLNNQYDSSEEVFSASNLTFSKSLLAQYDDQLLHTRVISNKVLRREIRRQHRIFAERMCEICKQKMLPGKDVAAIMNMRTGKLACLSRNPYGGFHLFHISCLIHWFLLCEHEIITGQTACTKGKTKSKRKSKTSSGESRKDGDNYPICSQIFSVFCPECQGTGIITDGHKLERDTFPLSQMFRYQIKVSDGRKGWVKCPEKLENCSTGLHFPTQSKESVQEKVSALKLLRFYKVDE